LIIMIILREEADYMKFKMKNILGILLMEFSAGDSLLLFLR